ncbi:PARP catalytic domain-containing protein [Phanerochaete sordida]|uniref:PARP catalytic domain-containing protein n=1 Tax=Phanerochaete sordida TaxID=48140 RepID=A0A9P3GLR5_9APHY|nr:PARP catalytic domain-containing protein [Phanerochaete sordida]
MGSRSSNRCNFPGCQAPVWVDGNGTPSSYCTRKHRDAMVAGSAKPTFKACKHCHTKPVHVEAGQVYEFCSRTCGRAHRQGTTGASSAGVQSQQTNAEMCLHCGRGAKTWVNNAQSDFCSIKCRDEVQKTAPRILPIPSWHAEFRDVAALFQDKWKHPATPNKPLPGRVLIVYKVYSRKGHMKRFQAYKQSVGNPRRRWHGTTRCCRLGDSPTSTSFCSNSQCALCSILKDSFKLAKAGRAGPSSYQRFGQGIYTSATSSKSFDYIKNLGGSPHLAMILTEVVMGKACKITQEDNTLTKPPKGYDSVVGEPGLTVNFDEAVVYTDDAIRPKYLIIFEPQ